MVKVRIVLGVRNLALQERLLRVPDLSLDKTTEHCKSAETAKFQQTLLYNQVAEVNYTVMENESDYQRQGWKETEKSNESRVKPSSKEEYDCKKCGRHHGPRNCPAYGKKYNDCGKLNHFKVGFSEKQNVTGNYNNNGGEHLFDTYVINVNKLSGIKNEKGWFENIKINGMDIKFKIDTGSDISIILEKILKK